jgi:hypothetical protein
MGRGIRLNFSVEVKEVNNIDFGTMFLPGCISESNPEDMLEMNGHHMRRRLVCKYELFGKVVNFNNNAAANCNGDN